MQTVENWDGKVRRSGCLSFEENKGEWGSDKVSERESSDWNATVFRSVSCSVQRRDRKWEGGGEPVNQATVCGRVICCLFAFSQRQSKHGAELYLPELRGISVIMSELWWFGSISWTPLLNSVMYFWPATCTTTFIVMLHSDPAFISSSTLKKSKLGWNKYWI